MGHGQTWLQFLPGYRQLEAYVAHQSYEVLGKEGCLLFGNVVVVQHVIAALLVSLVVLFVAARARATLLRAPDGGLIPPARPSLGGMVELGLEALYGQMKQIIGPDAKR